MAATNVLSDKDVNAVVEVVSTSGKSEVKSMEYHRQVLQSKMEQDAAQQYVSPSDTIMSPCTAKLSKLRNKNAGKVKPKSLFAQASVKKLGSENAAGARSTTNNSDDPF
ncbi:Spo12 family [Microdochium nivale]|nr:Spo12 family [Microdochium nivale]